MANTDLYNAKNEKVGEVELPGGLFGGRISQALLHEVSTITRRQRAHRDAGHEGPRRGLAAAAASPGSRRAPAGPARGARARRSGGTAGSSSGRCPRSTTCACPSPSAGPRCAPRSPGSCATAWSTSSRNSRRRAARPRCSPPGSPLTGWRDGGVLALHTGDGPELARAGSNLPDVKVARPGGFALNDLVGFRHLVLTRAALAAMEEQWAK